MSALLESDADFAVRIVVDFGVGLEPKRSISSLELLIRMGKGQVRSVPTSGRHGQS